MTLYAETLARWLADYYLLASFLLVVTLAASWFIAQPARRVALIRATLAGLALLAALCALPGWSVVHLMTRDAQAPPAPVTTPAVATDVVPVETIPIVTPVEPAPLPPVPEVASVPVETASIDSPAFDVGTAEVVGLVFLAGTLFVIAWQLVGHWRARVLVQGATEAPAELQRMLNELSGEQGGRGSCRAGSWWTLQARQEPRPPYADAPRLRISPALPTAVALGILRPTILLPKKLVETTDLSALRTILAHELAHIRHGDLLLLALCRALFALLWANPLFWLLRRRLRLDQETLADAAAAEETTRHQYAEQLVDWAKRFATDRPPALAAAVGLWESPSQLRRRIAVLLDERLTIWRECSRRWRLASLVVCAGVAVGLSLVTLEPGLAELKEVDGKPAAVNEQDETKEKIEPESANENTFPITVTGRSLDEKETPVPNAQVYLVSPRTNGAPLATTKSDDQGNYRFKDIPLPIKPPNTNSGKRVGSFEVFGIAKGHAFAWRPLKWFYPNSAHVDGMEKDPTWDLPYKYGREDPIEIDLYFTPQKSIRGRLINELGEPIPNATLAIRDGEPSDDDRSLRSLEAFNWPSLVPKSVKFRTTDKDGRFEFTSLPEDHVFRVDVRPPGYTQRMIYVSTREWTFEDPDGVTTYSNDSEILFKRPRNLELQVIYGDTGKPAPKVGIGGLVLEAGFWEATKDDGMVVVPLPDGTYKLTVFPQYGTPYLRTETEVLVSAETANEVKRIELRPAAVVEISVVDADTGEPLSGVDVWVEENFPNSPRPYREVRGYRSWEVETRISQYERPRTGEDGKTRVLFEPGVNRIGIAHEAFPKGYLPVNPDGIELDLEAGKPVEVQFEMRRIGTSSSDLRSSIPVSTEKSSGTLTARFLYDGVPPKPRKLTPPVRRTLDGRELGPIGAEIFKKYKIIDESLVVGEGGEIANVFVWVRSKDIPVSPETNFPPVTVSLKNGRYVPHAMAFQSHAQAPREVVFRNEEDYATNFNYQGIHSHANILVKPGEQASFRAKPEPLPVPLSATIHPWLIAYLLPVPNPYFAVSDESGTIRIENLPPGEWEFVAWHERVGFLNTENWPRGRFKVAIEAGENDLGAIKLAAGEFEKGAAGAAENTRIRKPVGGGDDKFSDYFILCPVTTDLQRSLLGDVSKPATDASLCVFVNGMAFSDDQISADSSEFVELADRLEELAKADNRSVIFKIQVDMSSGIPFDTLREQATMLAQLCEILGRGAGYRRAKWVRSYDDVDWKSFKERAHAAARLTNSNVEDSIGNERVRVFPVRTYLSRLLVSADCVVNVVPVLRQVEGTRFPDDFLPAMTQFIPQLNYVQKQKLSIRVRYAESAKDHLEAWVNNRQARKEIAREFGFEDFSLAQTFANEPEEAPKAAAKSVQAKSQPNIISGRCVDEQGKPLGGVKVVLLSTSSGVPIQYKSISATTTGLDGAFRFDQSQEVAKEYPDGIPERFPFTPKAIYTVLAQAEGRAAAYSSVTLERVGFSGHFANLTMPPEAKLRGTVTDSDGKPVPGVQVSAGQMSLLASVKLFSDVTDENGGYEIGSLQPWSLEEEKKRQGDQFLSLEFVSGANATFVSVNRTLTFSHPDYAIKRLPYERIPDTIDAQLQSAATIEGRVVDAGGQPVIGAVVRLTSMYKSIENDGKSEPIKDWFTQNHQAQSKTDEEGRYRFDSVPTNDYRLRVSASELITRGLDDLEVKTGAHVAAPDMVMSEGGRLRIQCVDAKSGEPFTVPKDAVAGIGDHWHEMPEMLASDVPCTEDGVIELQIAPGEHRISVSMIYSPEKFLGQMSDIENLPVVDVKEGETVEIRVPVVSAETLREQSSRVDPNSAKITEAAKLNAEHKPREALKILNELLQKDPKNLEALLTRAWSWDQLGEYHKGIEDYERIVAVNPNATQAIIAYNNWAYILATSNDDSVRDGKRAVELVKKAQQLADGPLPDLLDTLAAAYAEAGDFEKAIQSQKEAIKLAPDRDDLRESLKLYQAGKPRRATTTTPGPESESVE